MRKFINKKNKLFGFHGDEPLIFLQQCASDEPVNENLVTVYKPASNGPTIVGPRIEQNGFWRELLNLGYLEIEPAYTPNSIRTYTGKVFDLKIMDEDSICIEDIAHALAYTNRFGGHLEKPYSVAQHSVLGAWAIGPEHRLAFLLHDATEAYIGDMPSPFKKLIPEFKAIEDQLMAVIAQKFGIQFPFHDEIKRIDQWMLDCEWNALVLKYNSGIVYWEPERAKDEFLKLFFETCKYLKR